ncbi:MAG: phosphatidate cytidylyltransferase [Nitrospirae bacterium]|nr:phosphatidate cytidylyltransferase [Nitrospirota bacterium]
MTRKQGKNSSFVKRHVVGALALPVFVAYVYYLPPWPWFLTLLAVVAVTALWEFYAMFRVPVKLYLPGIMIGAALFYLSCRHPDQFFYGVFSGLCALLLLRLVLSSSPSGAMSEIGPVATGFFYVAVFLSYQWLLRTGKNGLEYIFLLYVSVWLSDSMAYYVGTYMGRLKLCPSISPNKTVEGAVGSVAGGALGAVIVNNIFLIPGLSVQRAAAIGVILGTAAVAGDLIESMFKRDAGVKDSSNLIPGHGGVLDKIDGFLVAGPALYFIVRYF